LEYFISIGFLYPRKLFSALLVLDLLYLVEPQKGKKRGLR
jgi:hypothetical protein